MPRLSPRDIARSSVIQLSGLLGLNWLGRIVQARKAGGPWGLVIGMHETPVSLREPLQRQLEWASEHFKIVALEEFATLWSTTREKHAVSKPLLLFTFDDGRESNYLVAAPLLESFGARGVFFVVPEFAECRPERALDFYRDTINPSSKPGDETWEDWRPMSSTQIGDLAHRGHTVGNHSLSHARLTGLGPEELENEIGGAARKIREWTNQPVEAFAWTFSWDAMDRRAWDVVRRHHRFCFAPCPGLVNPRVDSPDLIWRREVEAKYSPTEYAFQYSGLGDAAWASRRVRLQAELRGGTAT